VGFTLRMKPTTVPHSLASVQDDAGRSVCELQNVCRSGLGTKSGLVQDDEPVRKTPIEKLIHV